MRSKLIEFSTDATIQLGGMQVPWFGPGLLLAIWLLFTVVWCVWRLVRYGRNGLFVGDLVPFAVVAFAIWFAPQFMRAIPVYGYGLMLFLGFLSSTWLASRRLEKAGSDPNIAWDVAMWIFVGGIVGARLFFVIQYFPRVFAESNGPLGFLLNLVNLQDGGLVFYGGAILGAVAFFAFCRRRGLSPLALGDVLIPSIFLGMTFGRIGCLLNGCCFGDYCELPWALVFPPDSVPFRAQIDQGFLAGNEPGSLPIHPTQVYSALNGLVLALLTWAYYPYRRFSGEVLAVGWIVYPISRFLVEFLRGDELGQFGTMFTISQYVSAALFATGLLFYIWRVRSSPTTVPLQIAA